MPVRTSSPPDAWTLADQLRPVLLRLFRQLRRDADRAVISTLQSLLLAAILERPGIGVGELARLEKLRSPTISAHIKSMTSAGLVQRVAAASGDKRSVGLVVTGKGRKAIDAIRKQRTDKLAQALAKLSPEARTAIGKAIAAMGEIVV